MTFVFNERDGCGKCPIRHRAICARCDADELVRLEGLKSYKTIEAGQTIIWRGDDLSHFSSLVSGIASLSRTLEDGRTQMVGLLLPSDFIGRPGRDVVEFDVTAVTDVTLCRFDRKPFEQLVDEIPHVSQRMMEMALDELDAARDWMVLLGRKTAREKIATFLEMIVRRDQTPVHSGGQHVLPLTREEIANFLGLTLETVSRQLSVMKKDGIVAFSDRRHFAITDLEALHAATGDDADGGMII
ncbi:transcriptional regulator FnrL [Pseudooctadecabacter jejudonensis]|uniref:Nitrogen fixation regulation protein FixK n=1 Tax=Pseudooctadecabacter jejudonensis TaxID=1391910 RepID=A0A1Y5SX67_9RHOB|nr:Crp/Fnr family transcriptional regulator [Pseudooctadecabacter jejudonensis]SLN48598.1 Nitrogen fixation regulation protein FixK [Pseudooctadecabacter jejudonensis]